MCRNIFRSLTNFISHKRVYCRSSFNASDHFHFRDDGLKIQDISTIIQAEQEINNNPNGAGTLPGTDDKSKDLSGIVERLLFKQHQSRTSNLNDFYEQIQTGKKTQHDDPINKSQTLKLNRVNDSDVAVYQSLQADNENSNMKDEVNKLINIFTLLWLIGLIIEDPRSSQNAAKNQHSLGTGRKSFESFQLVGNQQISSTIDRGIRVHMSGVQFTIWNWEDTETSFGDEAFAIDLCVSVPIMSPEILIISCCH